MAASRTVAVTLAAILVLGLLGGCSEGEPGPKDAVISMFGAMQKDDQAALIYWLDLPELMRTLNEDYALQSDNPRVFTSPEQILDDLTGDGRTKQTWFALQRIIGRTEITSETTATVEVTFVDKEKSQGYRTHFGVHQVNGKWRVYSFKTIG